MSPKHRTAWERVQIARNPARPKTLDYVARLLQPWVELHGDRAHGDDAALVAGIGSFRGRSVVVLGHQRGGDTKENLARNFGMPRPEAYRKAGRIMEMAGKFALPLVCFIDTPGADPGIHSEERGQAFAIAANLCTLANLPVPVVATVIGEGGSGGALAIGAGDRILMLENSVYSVASPEASAAILWRDSAKAPEAAAAMKITAADLVSFGIADGVIPEPADGAHVEPAAAIDAVGERISAALDELDAQYRTPAGLYDVPRLLEARVEKYRGIGAWREEMPPVAEPVVVEASGD
ncbi:MAG: acetyl-CoA carboxylase carboxyltransferase subunit alpha [Chloroflexota bacterium]|nr:acetyl-CoA carboxylase carboxyltransferase subunit alpha [Chloroflexota bacterium]